jgi:hypothetical protein
MTLADQLVTEARTWRNTPFLHQGRLKNLGVDCAGFIGEVAKNVGIEVEIPHDYKPQEDGTAMMGLLSKHLDFVSTEDVQPGDVLALIDEALRFPDIPRHLAFVTEVRAGTIFLIHASEHGVREHRTNEHWRKRIHSVWRLKDAGTKKKAPRTRSQKAKRT